MWYAISAMILMTSFLYPQNGRCETGSLPKELLDIARKNGCQEVKNFYARPGMIKPPYVYGYLPDSQKNSAAFWCEKIENDRKIFFLILMTKGEKADQFKCSNTIRWENSFPGGLSLYTDRNTTLEGFRFVKDPEREVSKNVKLTQNAILSEYDGVELLFYCYEGEWVVRIRH